jgi:peptidyl-prolyl cis-trans isomerase SurA
LTGTPLNFRTLARRAAVLLLLACAGRCFGQAQAAQNGSPLELDRVVAVVNNRAILASDIADEIRLSVLDPNTVGRGSLTPRRAMQQLISRAIIQQQIRDEDAQALEPTKQQVDERLAELRKELPSCVRQNCASDAGWSIFLSNNGLTQDQVENYLRLRLEVLGFIENRFRQGIRISQEEIHTYYQRTLVPQYAKGEPVPSLEAVSPRIEEILLQRQVNALFGAWLDNLRKQGEVEVLDPTLETASSTVEGSGDR